MMHEYTNGSRPEATVETIERAKGEAETLWATLAELTALDPDQVMAARYELQDMQEWLHGLWRLAREGLRSDEGEW